MSDFNFEKFVQDQEKRDSQKSQSRTKIDKDNPERNPNRDFFERIQEKWQNRVKWLK